jgi:biotin-dependent carboxylase-like uncharacterized protein
MGTIEVADGGLLTTIQDAHGRRGYSALGITAAGAIDWFSAQAANALLDNPVDAALFEITLLGPTLHFTAPSACALTGADLRATLDGVALTPGGSYFIRAGNVLAFGERRDGVRAYLAVAGGVSVPLVLGARATDLRAGFGGLGGRRVQRGDRLSFPLVSDPLTRAGRRIANSRWTADLTAPVRVLPGPHLHRFYPGALEDLCALPWRITDQADRMGYRLSGGGYLRHTRGADIPSVGIPVGAVQVPGDERPIVLLADHQTTGGYTVLACVISADLPLIAQRQSGDEVRFAITSQSNALLVLRQRRMDLLAIERDAIWDSLRLTGA